MSYVKIDWEYLKETDSITEKQFKYIKYLLNETEIEEGIEKVLDNILLKTDDKTRSMLDRSAMLYKEPLLKLTRLQASCLIDKTIKGVKNET